MILSEEDEGGRVMTTTDEEPVRPGLNKNQFMGISRLNSTKNLYVRERKREVYIQYVD